MNLFWVEPLLLVLNRRLRDSSREVLRRNRSHRDTIQLAVGLQNAGSVSQSTLVKAGKVYKSVRKVFAVHKVVLWTRMGWKFW